MTAADIAQLRALMARAKLEPLVAVNEPHGAAVGGTQRYKRFLKTGYLKLWFDTGALLPPHRLEAMRAYMIAALTAMPALLDAAALAPLAPARKDFSMPTDPEIPVLVGFQTLGDTDVYIRPNMVTALLEDAAGGTRIYVIGTHDDDGAASYFVVRENAATVASRLFAAVLTRPRA